MTEPPGRTTSTKLGVPASTIVPEAAITAILQAIHGLRYGQVTIVVQDSRIMQIDRTERFRLSKTPQTPPTNPLTHPSESTGMNEPPPSPPAQP